MASQLTYKRGNPRQSNTVKEWTVQGHYGYGWEDLMAHDTIAEANATYQDYENNERAPHRIIMRRVPV